MRVVEISDRGSRAGSAKCSKEGNGAGVWGAKAQISNVRKKPSPLSIRGGKVLPYIVNPAPNACLNTLCLSTCDFQPSVALIFQRWRVDHLQLSGG